MSATVVGPDGKPRCPWSDSAPEFLKYHDTERPDARQRIPTE